MKLTESVGIRLLEKSISFQQMISAICDFTPICLVVTSDDGKKEMDLTENVRIELLEKSDRDPNSRQQRVPTHISTKLRQHNSRCTRLSQHNSACTNLS